MNASLGVRFKFDVAELRKVRQRFRLISHSRIERVRQCLNPRQQLFLDLLPLLFHLNHPLMPGYVTKGTPCGLSGYTPARRTLLSVVKQIKTFPVAVQLPRAADIDAIYLMGSGGSIGYSDHSDLDIWICHRTELNYSQLEQLRQKCHNIARWAASLGLEANFYPLAAENFYERQSLPPSLEENGSIQKHFLLDEFYRTGLLVAGKYPLWWLVHPSFERDYMNYVDLLKSRRFIKAHEYVDFGPVVTFSPEEFLSAAIWQLFKSIGSPNKSLLKVLLLETYAKEYPQIDLLSLRYKSAIYSGTYDLDALDPYLSLLKKVEDYLQSTNDWNRLELSRRCFYSKVRVSLSTKVPTRDISWRRVLLQAIVEHWNWDDSQIRTQDERDEWKIEQVLTERAGVTAALASVYRTLSDFAHRYPTAVLVNQRGASLLGRQLLIAFGNTTGKVQIINQDISSDLSEKVVSIHQVIMSNAEPKWLLFRGIVDNAEPTKCVPLWQCGSLVDLLAWCHFNGIVTPRSLVFFLTKGVFSYSKEVNDAFWYFRHFFPTKQCPIPEAEALAQSSYLISVGILVNFALDPLESYTKEGNYLSSQRTDALNYGSERTNLAEVLHYLTVNSWGEVIIRQFSGTDGLLECLCFHVHCFAQQSPLPASAVSFYSWNAGYGRLISQRVRELFADVTEWFQTRDACNACHYILQAGGDFHALISDKHGLRHVFSGCHRELLAYLSSLKPTNAIATVDRWAEQIDLESTFALSPEKEGRGRERRPQTDFSSTMIRQRIL